MNITRFHKQSPVYIQISMAVFIACFALSAYFGKPTLLYLGFYIALYCALYELATQLNNTQDEKTRVKHLGYIPIFNLLLVGMIVFSPPAMLITSINLVMVGIIIYQLVQIVSAKTKQPKEKVLEILKRNKIALFLLLLATTVFRFFFDSEGLAISNHCFLLFAALAVFEDCKGLISGKS